MTARIQKSDADWRKELTPTRFDVLRRGRLGHVFDGGPTASGGKGSCINPAALHLDGDA